MNKKALAGNKLANKFVFHEKTSPAGNTTANKSFLGDPGGPGGPRGPRGLQGARGAGFLRLTHGPRGSRPRGPGGSLGGGRAIAKI